MIIKRFFKLVFMIFLWALELVARTTWLLLPLGFHVFFLQMRKNVDKLPALTGYFSENSTWQMVYDGVVIVNTNPGSVEKRFNNIKNWFIKTKWLWAVLAALVVLGSIVYIAYKVH